MNGSLSIKEANIINNMNKEAQNTLLGTNMRIALQGFLTNPKHVLYLDGTAPTDGNGESWETAFNNPVTAIARLNQLYVEDPGKVYTLKIAPDFYTITTPLILTAWRCHIMAVGAPEDTVFFGSGLSTDLFTVQSGYNIISGLTLYNHLATHAALAFDDVGGGAANGGFSVVDSCQFSPQAVDGQNYGIRIKGANFIEIMNCRFQATKQAGIWYESGVGNSVRVRVRNCTFIGCNNGIELTGAAYNWISQNNVFVDGSEAAGENYNMSILTTAGHTAGSIIDIDGKHGGAAAANCFTNGGGGGTVQAINPTYIITVP
jgi:parallel beta-helix repeat protein